MRCSFVIWFLWPFPFHNLKVNTGREINFFFSDSHLAPKFFKVVANSKKGWSPFSNTNKIFLYTVSILDRPSKIKLGRRSLTCYKVDTRMGDIQLSSSPKSNMASSYQLRCMCCTLETNLTRKFAADLSLQIIFIQSISFVRLWWNILVANLVTKF